MRLSLLLALTLLSGCAAANIGHVEFGLPGQWPPPALSNGNPLVTVLPLRVSSSKAESTYAIFFNSRGELVIVMVVQPISTTQQIVPPALNSPFANFLMGLLK